MTSRSSGGEALQARQEAHESSAASRPSRDRLRRPRSHRTAEETFLDHHLEQLLDEERIPLRGRGDPCAHVLIDPRLAEQLFDDPADLGFTQRLERDSDPVGLLTPVLPELEELGSREADEQQRPSASSARWSTNSRKVALPSGRLRTRARAARGRRSPRPACGRPRRPRGRGTGRRRARSPRPRARRRPRPEPRDRRAARASPERRGRIVVGDGSRLPHGLAQGPERDTAPVREAAAAQQQAPGERIVERGEQARLPHARITEDRRQPAVPSAAASMCSRRRRRSSRSLPTSGAALR